MKYWAKWIAMGYLLGCATLAQAQQVCSTSIPESTPGADFTDSGNATVTHSKTGLMWKRCAEGQSWSGATCTGSASSATWANALKAGVSDSTAGYNDWRLPNLKELRSIVEEKCYGPSINASVFPNTSASYFWSASAAAYYSDFAWDVNFGDGGAYSGVKSYTYQFRLVRAGQSFGSFDALDPVPLSVVKTGVGSVSGGPISCGSTCSGSAGRGFDVTLTATLAANLIAWGGACASAGAAATCTLTMDAAKSVTATFKDTPLITNLPTLLSFALQNIASTSTAQHVTLTNTGTATLASLSITASAEYAVSHNCGSGLVLGGNCTLDITFTPSAIGTRSGSITIASNAPGSPHSIALTGTGQGSTSVASPTSWNFGSQGVGTTSTARTVTLSNTGGAVLNISSKVANGDFVISASTCSATLAQASSCSISITFSPITVGALSGSLVISSDALASPTTTVTLNGTGTPVALVSLNLPSLTFAAQTVGSPSAEQTVVLTNTGGAALTLAVGSIAASAEFAVTSNTCGGGLGAGGFCNLGVTFTPSATGNRTGTLTISSNAVGSPSSLSLTGTGRSPNAPICTLSATPPKVRKGATSTLTALCNPAATSWSWSGGTCAGTTATTCNVSPLVSTAYSVTGSNSYGDSMAAANVTVHADLTPILMLLLD